MKKNGGFTLIEVMIAMGVLTTSVFFISEIMLKSLVRIQENQDNIEKVFFIKRELYLNFFKIPINEKKVVTRLEDPILNLTTEVEDIANKSSLKDYKDVVKIMKSRGLWKKDNKPKESEMLSLVFIPKKEVKK